MQPYKPTRDQRIVLGLLANGPRGEDDLFRYSQAELTPQRVARALETLAKNGLVRDTGRRTDTWGPDGRRWIWELVPAPEGRADEA